MDVVEQATCISYRAGHQSHHIMIRRYTGHGQPGTVTGFDGDRVLLRTIGGENYRWWHHHPLLLRATVATYGRWVTLIPTLPVLQVGGRWFHCSTEPSPCSSMAGLRP